MPSADDLIVLERDEVVSPAPPTLPGPLPEARRRPRVWSVILASLLPLPVILIVSIALYMAVAIVMAIAGGVASPRAMQRNLEEFIYSPGGLLASAAVSQAVIGGIAVAAALLSRVPLRERLRLNKPNLSVIGWVLILPATMAMGFIGDFLVSRFFEDTGESMKMIAAAMVESRGLVRLSLVLAISVLPGVFEELLYRGYVQPRLLRRWHPALAVGFASLVFAGIHMDPAHVLGVIPLAFWLGFLAWRTGSTWPSILCHGFNNLIACLVVMYWPEAAGEELTAVVEPDPWSAALTAALFLALAAAVFVLLRWSRPVDRVAQPT